MTNPNIPDDARLIKVGKDYRAKDLFLVQVVFNNEQYFVMLQYHGKKKVCPGLYRLELGEWDVKARYIKRTLKEAREVVQRAQQVELRI